MDINFTKIFSDDFNEESKFDYNNQNFVIENIKSRKNSEFIFNNDSECIFPLTQVNDPENIFEDEDFMHNVNPIDSNNPFKSGYNPFVETKKSEVEPIFE